jgi:GxxExxY protein
MLLHENTTNVIIGAFYSVYNELGYGFLESVYEKSLVITLNEAGLKVEQQKPLPVRFRDHMVGEYYADLVVHDAVILDLKSCRTVDRSHEAQLLHYLKATEIEVGLLLNFGERPQFRRLLFDNSRKKIRGNPCESVASFGVTNCE